ncbi:hypothetical protein [Novosphingobium sp. FSW06-99]|uniref:hypothetical protein n=1 Tax=Novosphingobium sp. FSW06-99 TaxID=1739113 RepID=UPI000ABCC632|nr:hypothetical protein [Novosphingobium sp. FSW06-99]
MTVQPAACLYRLPLALMLCATAPAIAMAQVSGLNAADKPAAAPAPASLKSDGPTTAQAPTGAVGGMGDINLYPKRVVIDDHNRVASVGVYNKTANNGDYEITITDMMMTTDGRLVELAAVKPDDAGRARVKAAGDMVRWSPHHFSLPGNESQMIRIMARVSPDLPPGEYRTHFSAVAVPPGDDGLTIDEATKGQPATGGIGVKITPRFGISIPVIIRVGETTLTAGLKDLAVTTTPQGQKLLRLTITRSGTRSSFGDISVTAPGAPKPVALIRGVGVYPEVDERTVTVPVDPAVAARFTDHGAKLTVTYVDDDYAPGKTLAKTDFIVP